ncbi:MAG: hypothetical protein ACKVOH_03925 [Chlamydiales bacterium]
MKTKYLLSILLLFSIPGFSYNICTITEFKSGTHLLWKVIEGGLEGPKAFHTQDINRAGSPTDKSIFTFHFRDTELLEFAKSHPDLKIVVNIRDFRDISVAVTDFYSYKFVNGNPFLEPIAVAEKWRTLPYGQQLLALLDPTILGKAELQHSLNNIRNSLNFILHSPNVYLCHFENLVGPKGGGTREAQIREITNILEHYGFAHSLEKVESIADSIWGTAGEHQNKGVIGRWKEHYKRPHVIAGKKAFGDLLITFGYEKSQKWGTGI